MLTRKIGPRQVADVEFKTCGTLIYVDNSVLRLGAVLSMPVGVLVIIATMVGGASLGFPLTALASDGGGFYQEDAWWYKVNRQDTNRKTQASAITRAQIHMRRRRAVRSVNAVRLVPKPATPTPTPTPATSPAAPPATSDEPRATSSTKTARPAVKPSGRATVGTKSPASRTTPQAQR